MVAENKFPYHSVSVVMWIFCVILHMGPEDNFCSTKISKDSVLAKVSDLM